MKEKDVMKLNENTSFKERLFQAENTLENIYGNIISLECVYSILTRLVSDLDPEQEEVTYLFPTDVRSILGVEESLYNALKSSKANIKKALKEIGNARRYLKEEMNE